MILTKNNNRLLFSCITTLTTIGSNHQRLLPFNSCVALSYRPTNNKLVSDLRKFKNSAISMSTSSSTSSSSSSSPSTVGQKRQRSIHLNHAGASTSPQRVLDRVYTHLQLEQDIGGYAAQNSLQDSGDLEKVYYDIAKLIHVVETPETLATKSLSPVVISEIALCESATVAWTRAFYTIVQRDEQERKARFEIDGSTPSTSNRVILVSEAEYAANVVAACQWARDHDDHWMVLAIPSSPTKTSHSKDGSSTTTTGIVDLQVFDSILEGTFRYKNKSGKDVCLDPSSIAIVCITHVPTNSGIVNPVEAIGEKITNFNQRRLKKNEQSETRGQYHDSIKYCVDACQSVGQMDVNVQKIKCDALVATGRKYLRGPRGTGFLYISNGILDQDIVPSHIDHYGCPIKSVPSESSYQLGSQLQDNSVIEFSPREGAKRFEFWESSIASRLGLGEAVCVAIERGLPEISRDIQRLSALLRNGLEEAIPSIRIHHKESTTCGIVTFYFQHVDARSIQAAMWKEGFELSMVPGTSTPLDTSSTKIPDLVRASISYITTDKEIHTFISILKKVLN